ncbi:MAG: hypothetical protein K2I77_03860, partial [Anaeroplasmataceae bacterium]|nr:hypothetical protein [Anaeroplasmataceae bacterium]
TIGKAFKWIAHIIYSSISFLCEILDRYLIRPIFLFFKFIGEKIINALTICIQFLYEKIILPIGRFIYKVLKKIILFIYHYLLLPIYRFLKWIINSLIKIFKAIGKFIYHYILLPIYHFLVFIYKKISQFFEWFINILIKVFKKIGKFLYKTFKLFYQFISVAIVITFSTILCVIYTFLIYPFKILFIENKTLASKKDINEVKKLFINSYYLIKIIKEKNYKQLKDFKEKKPDLVIFIQIKNIVAIIPSILYSILLYPINIFMIILFSLFSK